MCKNYNKLFINKKGVTPSHAIPYEETEWALPRVGKIRGAARRRKKRIKNTGTDKQEIITYPNYKYIYYIMWIGAIGEPQAKNQLSSVKTFIREIPNEISRVLKCPMALLFFSYSMH